MTNVLFDLISLQDYRSGGGEYVKKVFDELLLCNSINIYGVYDSELLFIDNDFDEFSKQIEMFDIRKMKLSNIINVCKIDILFIGIIQRYNPYDLNNIYCKVICVMHDIGDIEITQNNIHFMYKHTIKNYIKLTIDYWNEKSKYSTKNRVLKQYGNIRQFLGKANVSLYTVSNYSSSSILYFFPELKVKNITVLYPPPKSYIRCDNIDDVTIQNLFSSGKRYLLFVNANRDNKNFNVLNKCIDKVVSNFPNMYIVVTGLNMQVETKNVIALGYVSNSDMENLYQKAWALIYASYTEGFGYPPIESLKYSVPVITSNVCSMPEILSNAVLYFSPFYENDLFFKIVQLHKEYQYYQSLSYEQYTKIRKKQEIDFAKLMSCMIDKINQ